MWNRGPIKLAYGKNGIELLPGRDWNLKVVEPEYPEIIPEVKKSLSNALQKPINAPSLNNSSGGNRKIGIVFNDITRPTPNDIIIDSIINELVNVRKEDITLFNALGTHRENATEELRKMLGDYLVDNYRIVQNNAFDKSTQVLVGKTAGGNDIWLNEELMSCDIKILTGFIEPHFFAGFSGGGKALMPGMAGLETILRNHNAQNIGHPHSSWGITKGNPIWEEVQEVLSMTGLNFLLNVTLNRDKKITGVFAGEPVAAHGAGVEFVKETAMVPVDQEFDVVVTTNSGYPLDLNLYQTVKGMSAAARIVKQGGVIIAVAECWDGIPDHGCFGEFLLKNPDPGNMLELINTPGFSRVDQWQAQILAQIQLKAEVYLYSDKFDFTHLDKTSIKKCDDITGLIEEYRKLKGSDISICMLPEGPQTIPYLT